MGIKSLTSFQMIPWCFPLIWNHISCVHLRPEPSVGTIKLIKSDGIVKIYDQPINASDLMIEFPKHLICHSDSFYIGQKIQALSENDKLQLGQKYFLLPKHFFQSVLSFVTIASFAASSSSSRSSSPIKLNNNSNNLSNNNKNEFIKKVATCQPFDIQKTASGSLQIRVSDEFISKLMEQGKIKDHQEENRVAASNSSKVCTTPQLEKDYSQLVGSVRQWKPKLETITESERRRKRLIGSFAGIHRNYKKKSQIQPKGYSSSSSTNTHQIIVKKQRSSSSSTSSTDHVTSTTTSSSSPAAHHHQPPCSKIKVIKTKGRKICKF